jgi:PmbA protein
MSREMLDTCAAALTAAKKAGAKHAKAALTRTRFVDIKYRERKPETIKEATTQNLHIEIYVDGRYSAQSTSDLRPAAIEGFIANAVAMTRLLAEDPYRSLPDPRYYQGRTSADLSAFDPTCGAVTPEQRHALARAIEDAALAAGGPKVISVTASANDQLYEMATLSTNGFTGETQSTVYSAGAQMTLQDEGDRRPNGYYYVTTRLRRDVLDPSTLGLRTAQRALDLLGARKIPTATLPVIVENQVAGNLLSGLVGAMSGGSIQQKRSFLADQQGRKIASEQLTLIDDPLLPGGLGSAPFDSDGFPARQRTIVERGVLKEFFVDWYYSRKLGWEPTTGRPSNLIIPAGRRSVAEIMKDLGRGIVVTGFLGGNSNSTTGDTSVGILGYLFENGVRTQPIAEMNVADNHLKFWQKLTEVANDPWIYDSWRLPSLVFTDVVVSGV